MRSYNYFHLIGDSQEASSLITSKLLLRYDDVEDEEITDTELFRETQSSRLIKQVLLDYKDLYPFANDGISIGSYCGKEIQPVIAGIDSYLVELLTKQREREYSLQLTIFSDSRDDSTIMQWVNTWKDRCRQRSCPAANSIIAIVAYLYHTASYQWKTMEINLKPFTGYRAGHYDFF